MQVFNFLWAPVVLLLVINGDVQGSRLGTFGVNLYLTDEEVQANRIIKNEQAKDLEKFDNIQGLFKPSRNITETLIKINESTLFHYVSKMPKGAVLHANDRALCSINSIMKLTYIEKCMVCQNSDERVVRFQFSKTERINEPNSFCIQLATQRRHVNDDEYFSKQLTINPMGNFLDREAVWKRLETIYSIVDRLLSYAPAWRQYFYNSLEEFLADGVQYFEFRSALPTLYDLKGTIYTPVDTVRICIETLKDFMKKHPTFIGCKLIYAPPRAVNRSEFEKYKKTFLDIKAQFPAFVAGFDLTPHLKDFARELSDMPETNWFSTSKNIKRLDVLQLSPQRYGNAFAKYVKNNTKGVEVLPISNQVFGFMSGYRNHPISGFFAGNYPVVVSSNHSSFFNIKPLSHDFYMAFLGIGSPQSDLRMFKQLAENSINYSTLTETEKAEAIKKWNSEWKEYIETFK